MNQTAGMSDPFSNQRDKHRANSEHSDGRSQFADG
jgi:hypothetical protein